MTHNTLVSKIVANATDNSWSQAYSTLNFYVVLSLEAKGDTPPTTSLASSGKDTLEKLQREFFALPEKKLFEIKKAVERGLEGLPEYLHHSLVLATIVDDVCYIVTSGLSSVILKRGNTIGIPAQGEEGKINAFSGFLEDNDIVLLQTEGFMKKIPKSSLEQLLQNTSSSEISENIAPLIHEGALGTEAAIVLYFKKAQDLPLQNAEEMGEDELPPIYSSPFAKIFRLPSLSFAPGKKALIIIAILILIVIFIASVFFERNAQKTKKDFDHKTASQKIPETTKPTSPEKKILFDVASSSDMSQITALTFKGNQLAVVDEKSGNLLLLQNDGTVIKKIESQAKNARAATADENYVYVLTDSSVLRIDKKSGAVKTIISLSNASDIETIDTFLGNIYTLNKKENTVEKYAAPSVTKSSYFVENVKLITPISMAIDSSIWVLQADGNIRKFTRGREENFSIKGLTTSLSKNSFLYTEAEQHSLYILDQNAKKIVIIDKNGTYQTSLDVKNYGELISFSVDEKDKKIFLATNHVIYLLEF